MTTLIMKFGGSAVGLNLGLTQMLSIVLHESERWRKLLIVVSALDGVTDQLLEATHLAQLSNGRGYRRIVANMRQRHISLIESLPLGVTEKKALESDIDQMLFEMLAVCQTLSDFPENVAPETIYGIVAVGERLSARIVAALLRQNGQRSVAIDATDLIITDNVFGNATPNLALTRQRITESLMPMLERKIIPVITGFIASTQTGKITVLGRGGSDYTASILGICTDAAEVWIWTDVDGMMTADPHEISSAHSILHMSYEEAAELAYFGARILHPRMIEPLRERAIPLRVRNVFRPGQPGTLVQSTASTLASGIKAVTSIRGLGIVASRSGSLTHISALVDDTLFRITGSRADVMIASQTSSSSFLAFVIPTSAGQGAAHQLEIEIEHLLEQNEEFAGWSARLVNIVTAIGAHLDHQYTMTVEILRRLADIKLLAISHGIGGCSISLVTEVEDADTVLNRVHDLILTQP